uniref:Uncharacterized protein n=1 Tax=Ananas comosus var. bracteatus TaxID=296719 RepID=A0A6V7P5P6_ANACO|nr:unnamed protein product [Ananas comosus var. bracteatus]
MGRRPCCSKEGQNKGAWSVSEDKILTEYIKLHGEGKWRDLPTRAGERDQAEPRQTLHNSKRRDVNVLDSSEAAATADEQSHQVIRTKAVRCTKVYLQMLQDLDDTAKPNNENIAPPSNETPSSFSLPPHAGSIDLFMDFNMEELMSSFADDGFYSLCNNNGDKDDGNAIGSYAGEDSLWFSETIQEEWRENNGADLGDFACI